MWSPPVMQEVFLLGCVKRTPGVRALAARDLVLSLTPNVVIDLLQTREDQSSSVVFGAERFATGQTMRITSGPFTDFDAVFVGHHDKCRCSIMSSMLGKQHSVLVLSHFLEKAA